MYKISPTSLLVSLSIPSIVLLHLICSPYTKIEESFSIQATHDIIAYGIPRTNGTQVLAHYDHVIYPGNHPVPRSFVGPVVLAGLSKPFIPFLTNGLQLQIAVRGVLGLFNALSLLCMRRAVSTAYGTTASTFYVLFQISQFHVMYYASRPLPNMFAFGLSTLAQSQLLLFKSTNAKSPRSGRRLRLALYLLTIAGVVLRSELALLLFAEVAYLLLVRRRRQPMAALINEILPAGAVGALIGLALTVPLDSHLWRDRLLWPEFAAFWFNTVQGQSATWGTSPWHFYATSALPRLLLNPLTWMLCIPAALASPATRRTSAAVVAPALAFVALYSGLPHKETRFVIYVVPGLTAVASSGAAWIVARRAKARVYAVLAALLCLSIPASAVVSIALLALSSLNYPGGVALTRLHALAGPTAAAAAALGDATHQAPLSSRVSQQPREIAVHIDTLAFHTGATHFLEQPPPDSALASLLLVGSEARGGRGSGGGEAIRWSYDKTDEKFYPDTLRSVAFWDRFEWALVEEPARAIGAWEVVETVYGYAGVRLLGSGEELGFEEDGVGVLLQRGLGEGKVWSSIWKGWKGVERVGRGVLSGRWVGIGMEPKIRILRRLRGVT
ncbi:MAG: dolichyl-P-Man:Man(7)GlcNAc(2)-PP-dolichol alpha-1,6-mannosyltransferase [Bathelium mastoideum]|nr:MAG: dolichyl-P-Man:Man(7)GlcNAc(2)-PP-dolichol alpha-1,6-mannosyltransferase [Bathelium mastoideum]